MIEHNGKKYARVTDILRPFTDFGHINPEVLANKARIGTQVHGYISEDIEDEFPAPSPECMGYYQSFAEWKHKLKPSFAKSESRYFCHDKMFTGQIDALIKFPGEQTFTLVDFKTSVQESPIVWPMQAHMYHYLLQKNQIDVSSRFLFIKLDKHGDLPKVFEYRFDPNVRAKCMNAVEEFWKTENL